jgi:alkylation response protein AidB-like acyl-CoA dehydrogenase
MVDVGASCGLDVCGRAIGQWELRPGRSIVVLIDLSTPGITRSPIRNIAGEAEFCDVFFDDVTIPAENIVGKVGEGWSIATLLLER